MTQNSKFDASKYQVSVEAKPITIKIPETGEEFEITVKQLSWTKRNHLLSKCYVAVILQDRLMNYMMLQLNVQVRHTRK